MMTGLVLTGIVTLFSGVSLPTEVGQGTFVQGTGVSSLLHLVAPLVSDTTGGTGNIETTPSSGQSILLTKKVTIEGKSDQATAAATYAFNQCLKVLPSDGYYGCKNFVLTLNAENRNRNPKTVSPMNPNKTYDHGICQLNSRYHAKFIKSKEFNSIFNQVDYCLEVWQDAKANKKMPRYAYRIRYERGTNVVFEL